MCGIVGFTGTQQAAPILLNGLSKLEYTGTIRLESLCEMGSVWHRWLKPRED